MSVFLCSYLFVKIFRQRLRHPLVLKVVVSAIENTQTLKNKTIFKVAGYTLID